MKSCALLNNIVIVLSFLEIVPTVIPFAFKCEQRKKKKKKKSVPQAGLWSRNQAEALCGYSPCKQGPVHCAL